MSEETKPQQSILSQLISFVVNIFTLDDINYKQSIENIKSEITFKGFNIWILICSILVCSLGLNMNSTAVVIGAMLISPLMGPIVGLGLGIGVFDNKLIWRALKNLGVAASISIITAFIFFSITPTEEVPELLARTKPTILDLFVAFFGGVAGILAASRCISTNVVPGVAIATALMPPLCTAGFGLAIGNFDYFLGAFYLFVMNCIMISVAALMVVLYLRYPKFSFVNEQRKKQARAGIIAVVLLVSIPSMFFYYNLLQENLLDDRVNNFVEIELLSNQGIYITNQSYQDQDSVLVLKLNINGQYLEASEILALEHNMEDYGITNGRLQITQPQPIGFKEQRLTSLKTDIIKELYQNSEQKLNSKDDEIELLKTEIQKLTANELSTFKVIELAKSQYDIDEMAVDILVFDSKNKQDTLPTALVDWKSSISNREEAKQAKKLADLLKIELGVDDVRIVEIN